MKDNTAVIAAMSEAFQTGEITHIGYMDVKGVVTDRPVIVSEVHAEKGFFRAETTEGIRSFKFDNVIYHS